MNWMTKDWTQGDLNAVIKKIGGEEVARGILNDTVKFTVTEMPKTSFDEFFQTRPRLFVSESFRDLVVAKAKGVATVVNTKHFDLSREMLDSEIEEKLGGGYVWDENVLLATLKLLLTKQKGGKKGKLVNTGFSNLFYSGFCVVSVCWRTRAVVPDWFVYADERVDRRWDAGVRAFSPAT